MQQTCVCPSINANGGFGANAPACCQAVTANPIGAIQAANAAAAAANAGATAATVIPGIVVQQSITVAPTTSSAAGAAAAAAAAGALGAAVFVNPAIPAYVTVPVIGLPVPVTIPPVVPYPPGRK